MKTLTQIAVLILTAQLAFGNIDSDIPPKKASNDNQIFTEFAIESHIKAQHIPWIGNKKISMEEIAHCGDYTLYRCKASAITAKNPHKLKGEMMHYMVYKAGNYHLAVNEYNHKAVFLFFMMNYPKADVKLMSAN